MKTHHIFLKKRLFFSMLTFAYLVQNIWHYWFKRNA